MLTLNAFDLMSDHYQEVTGMYYLYLSNNNNVYHVQLIINAFCVDMTVLLYWCFSSMSCYTLLLKLTNE